MVFQIVDDILDVVATEEELGKPAGNDLTEGVYTLPVIRALAAQDTAEELRRLLRRHIDKEQVERARTLVRLNGAVPAALDVAREYAERACDALEPLGAGEVVDALRRLPNALVSSVAAV
jgi:geranylgeranyl pyrophosphate synthase